MPAWPLAQSLRSGDVDPAVREAAESLVRSGRISAVDWANEGDRA
ncbi:hypothetical protein [Paenibacillus antri]|nr:hypothetical protein [Paenibacillus antri]